MDELDELDGNRKGNDDWLEGKFLDYYYDGTVHRHHHHNNIKIGKKKKKMKERIAVLADRELNGKIEKKKEEKDGGEEHHELKEKMKKLEKKKERIGGYKPPQIE